MYNRIKELREDKDMNQTDLGKIIGMSQTGYSQYETGKNDIPTTILIKLAIFYNTSIDYLLRAYKSENALSSCEYEHKKMRVSYSPIFIKHLFCAMYYVDNFKFVLINNLINLKA